MEKIKVREYVRLARNQGINRIEEIDDDGDYILDEFIADEWGDEVCCISKNDLNNEIIKHSPNIIDLIEVGDYVNGWRVFRVVTIDNIKYVEVEWSDGVTAHVLFTEKDIKSIVTKEQYEAIKYVIGE